jgi:hypothetical protein
MAGDNEKCELREIMKKDWAQRGNVESVLDKGTEIKVSIPVKKQRSYLSSS